jgi:hypothetical protein
MRTRAAIAVLALLALAGTPAAFAKGSVTIDGRLIAAVQGLHAHLTPVVLTKKDRMKSCQVGASRSRVRGATETQRKASTVACEQPPRSSVNLSGGLKAAEAAAILAGG